MLEYKILYNSQTLYVLFAWPILKKLGSFSANYKLDFREIVSGKNSFFYSLFLVSLVVEFRNIYYWSLSITSMLPCLSYSLQLCFLCISPHYFLNSSSSTILRTVLLLFIHKGRYLRIYGFLLQHLSDFVIPPLGFITHFILKLNFCSLQQVFMFLF